MKTVKYKYLLFSFNSYECSGGMDDLALKFNTFEEFEQNFKYEYYYHQLVETTNFTFEEFSTKITYHVGIDDYELIKEKRTEELINWVREKLKGSRY